MVPGGDRRPGVRFTVFVAVASVLLAVVGNVATTLVRSSWTQGDWLWVWWTVGALLATISVAAETVRHRRGRTSDDDHHLLRPSEPHPTVVGGPGTQIHQAGRDVIHASGDVFTGPVTFHGPPTPGRPGRPFATSLVLSVLGLVVVLGVGAAAAARSAASRFVMRTRGLGE
jgi:hypothetical protein